MRLHFLERLPHSNEARATAGWIKDHIGQPPAELFGQLVAEGFFAFEPIRFFQRRHFEPVFLCLAAGDLCPAVGD